MQPIKVRKVYDIALYDVELDMMNFKCENASVYKEVRSFFAFYSGNWALERTQDLIVASNYNHRKNKNSKILKNILEN